MRAQVSFEYMMVFALAIAFAIPVWIYASSFQQSAGEELSLSYASNAASQITNAADLVYTQGPPAKVRLNIYIPAGIEETNITGKTIILKVRSAGNLSDVFSVATANLTGTIPDSEGMYWISVESKGDYVQIAQE
jgi:uncharacterized protein (UPF0333 family)